MAATHLAYAEIAGPDESPFASRSQQHHWRERVGDSGCDLAGERDPVELAKLCHWRVKSSRDTVAKALEGDYRYEHLFTLNP